MNSNGAVVTATDLSRRYGEGEAAVDALRGVSLSVGMGELVAVMGPSGSGKSTLLHCISALDRLTSGTVELAGVDLSTLSDKELTLLRRRAIGFVFQSFNLVPTLNLRENVTLPIDLAGDSIDQAWYEEVISRLDLGDRLTHRPSELSGGQQQRAAVARALVTRPDVVFADEPTGNLDSRSGSELLQLLRSTVDDHDQTIVMVTHDAGAAAYSDRVVFLMDGHIVHELEHPTRDSVLDTMKQLDDQAVKAGV